MRRLPVVMASVGAFMLYFALQGIVWTRYLQNPAHWSFYEQLTVSAFITLFFGFVWGLVNALRDLDA